jgi:hypothetical protein
MLIQFFAADDFHYSFVADYVSLHSMGSNQIDFPIQI